MSILKLKNIALLQAYSHKIKCEFCHWFISKEENTIYALALEDIGCPNHVKKWTLFEDNKVQSFLFEIRPQPQNSQIWPRF